MGLEKGENPRTFEKNLNNERTVLLSSIIAQKKPLI